MTLLVYNLLTVIVSLENLDAKYFEILNAESAILGDDSNQDDDFDIE
jgi:hypothetical protein